MSKAKKDRETVFMPDYENIQDKRNAVLKLVGKSKGQYFSVKFIKKDGSERIMSCHSKLASIDLKGGKNTTAHIDKYTTLWEKGSAAKNVNMDTLWEVQVGGVTYLFNKDTAMAHATGRLAAAA